MTWDRISASAHERLLFARLELAVAQLGLAALRAEAAGGQITFDLVGDDRLLIQYRDAAGRFHVFDSAPDDDNPFL